MWNDFGFTEGYFVICSSSSARTIMKYPWVNLTGAHAGIELAPSSTRALQRYRRISYFFHHALRVAHAGSAMGICSCRRSSSVSVPRKSSILCSCKRPIVFAGDILIEPSAQSITEYLVCATITIYGQSTGHPQGFFPLGRRDGRAVLERYFF